MKKSGLLFFMRRPLVKKCGPLVKKCGPLVIHRGLDWICNPVAMSISICNAIIGLPLDLWSLATKGTQEVLIFGAVGFLDKPSVTLRDAER